jgi:hypothetical protein
LNTHYSFGVASEAFGLLLLRRGDRWAKTCLTPSGSRIRVRDPCYGSRTFQLVIVPGDWVVAARCDSCGRYGNAREFSEVSLGGHKGASRGRAGRVLRGGP